MYTCTKSLISLSLSLCLSWKQKTLRCIDHDVLPTLIFREVHTHVNATRDNITPSLRCVSDIIGCILMFLNVFCTSTNFLYMFC